MSTSGKPMRRNASPSTKQGPIRATVQFGLVQGSPARNAKPKVSPSSSPTPQKTFDSAGRKGRSVSESRLSPERRSPISTGSYKVEKPKAVRSSPSIKRSGSLEAIAGNSYLSGQWPRDLATTGAQGAAPYLTERATSDKATQTDDWDCIRRTGPKQRIPSTSSNGDVKDMYKQCVRRHKGSSSTSSGFSRQSPVQGNHSAFKPSLPMRIPVTPRLRRSVEALNQEVEKLIVCGYKSSERERTPDGHKAPTIELLCTPTTAGRRHMNTQTPKSEEDVVPERISCNSTGSGGSRSQSVSPAVAMSPGQFDIAVDVRPEIKFDKDVEPASPDESITKVISGSPKPNNAFVREPPDGCEIIKIGGESRKPLPPPVKECLLSINAVGVGEFKQSERSAFCTPPSAQLSPSAFLQESVH